MTWDSGEIRELQVTVESIAGGGDGVARTNGLVVFLPRTAPGDVGIARATIGKSFARGRLTTLERPSSQRVEPPCPHYVQDDCGGCQLQHLSYEGQLDAKRRIVVDAFERIAHRQVEVPPVEASREQWRYRAKLTLALRRRAPGEGVREGSLSPPDSPWVAGLHPFDDPSSVFELVDCPITHSRLMDSWRELLAAGALLPETDALRVSARLTSDGMAVVVQGGERWTTVDAFIDSVSSASELWWAPRGEPAQLLRGRAADVRPDDQAEPMQDEPGAAFVQVNPEVADSLRAYVLRVALAESPRTAVDAYAGTGAYARRLSEAGVRVTAIERDAVAAAFMTPLLAPPSLVVPAPVERALGDALPADLVIVNPPRAGLHASVSELLSSGRPRPSRLIYVSCNPATLARDVGRLSGWRVASVRAFDMFPQTAHVEVVCEMLPEER